MRLISYSDSVGARAGVVRSDNVIAVSDILGPDIVSMRDVIAAGTDATAKLAAEGVADGPPGTPLSDLKLAPVVPDPEKIVCIGLNYADHAREGGHDIPDYPALFMRARNSLIAHGDAIIRPACSDTLDYEAELLLVIGERAKHVSEADALDHVFGYSIFNDGSVREYQRKSGQWTAGKNFDRTGPAGPWIVTPDELPPGAAGLDIRSRLNGEVMQSSNTRELIFTVPRTIAILSEFMTLEPGDLVAMGTPAGVGYPRTPPVFMRPGDVIEVEIEGIGVLRNTIEDE